MRPPFSAGKFRAALATRRLGRGRVAVHETTASTNDEAFALAESAPAESAVVVAEFQSAGRGRFGRRFEAPPFSALLASVSIPGAPLSAALLSAAAAVAAAEALERAGVGAGIKWPNDLLASGRKIAGLLLEARDLKPESPLVVLGYGLNVAQSEEELPAGVRATSIRIETGAVPRRENLLAAFLLALERRVEEVATGDAAGLLSAYRRRNLLLGRRVAVLDRGREIAGSVVDLSPETGLVLGADSGDTLRLAAEHVTIARIEGFEGA